MQRLGFPNDGMPILVAVSGGVDSMVLASLLLESGYSMAVAHCNYQLRGEDSEADEALAREWCAENGIPFHVKRIDTQKLAESSNSSIQMVARNERYGFFEELMDQHGYVATTLAHHANDRVESLILNVLRGTGFRGLQGMPSQRDRYIRPLIEVTKEDLVDFAGREGVRFQEDRSNREIYYERNWVRLRLLPMILAFDKKAFHRLQQLCERADAELPNYQNWVKKEVARMLSDGGISIQGLEESKAPFTILKEILEPKGFSSDQVFEVIDILKSTSGAEVRSDSHRIVKDRNTLIISELGISETTPKLQFELIDRNKLSSLNSPKNVLLLDADQVDLSNLTLRKWQQGDRFKPLGMKGWKLLSDLFIDQKLSIPDKERVWVLTLGQEIVWVVGIRPDDRFKVTDSTKHVLRVVAPF